MNIIVYNDIHESPIPFTNGRAVDSYTFTCVVSGLKTLSKLNTLFCNWNNSVIKGEVNNGGRIRALSLTPRATLVSLGKLTTN